MRPRLTSALVLLAAGLRGQEAEQPVYRATTRLVEFSVVALDKQGHAVADLKKDEIEIFDKGKRRPVAFFRFEGAAQKRVVQPLPQATYSNRVEYSPGPPRNITALVLDTLNTPPRQTMWVRAQLARYLKALAPETRVAVYHLGAELKVLHDFTDDYEALRGRVEKSVLGMPLQAEANINEMVRDAEMLLQMFPDDPVLEEMLRNQIEIEGMANAGVRQRRLEGTLAALESLGTHLAGIPGRKNLVWIGGGISMLSITGAMGFGPHGGWQSYEQKVEESSRRLAQQGVALYVVDARGLTVPQDVAADVGRPMPVRGRGRFERQQQAEETSADPLPAAFKMADITGGRVIRNTNDPAEGMRLAAEDVRGAYTVAFYAEGEPDGKWHGLKVRTRRKGVRLAYRQGFQAEDETGPTEWSVAEWRAAAVDPLGSSSIGVDAFCRAADEGPAGTLTLLMQLEPSHLHFRKVESRIVAEVEIGLAEKTATGPVDFVREVGKISYPANRERGISPADTRYPRTWKPGEGVTHIRVIVRDKYTGRHGTLDVPVPKAAR